MWFGYVPQIKNTNVISARGLHFSRFPSSPLAFFFLSCRQHFSRFPPPIFLPFYPLSHRHFCFPRPRWEWYVSTLESHHFHLHMYTCALAYKLFIFGKLEERVTGREEKTRERLRMSVYGSEKRIGAGTKRFERERAYVLSSCRWEGARLPTYGTRTMRAKNIAASVALLPFPVALSPLPSCPIHCWRFRESIRKTYEEVTF